jgi:predicted MFS family arabinose efflux permease
MSTRSSAIPASESPGRTVQQGPSDPPARTVSQLSHSRVRPVLAAAPVISYADRFGFLPILAAAAAGLRVPVHVIGTAVTVYFLLYGLAQPVIGRLSDRYGRVVVLRWALGILALADLAAGLAPGPAVLIAARAVAGAASGALLPTALVYLGDAVEFRFRQRAVSRVLAAAALGAGVAMAAAGLLARWWSWRLPLFVVAGLAPAVLIGLRRLPEPEMVAGPSAIRRLLRCHPALLALFVFALFEGAAMLGFFTFFAPALEAHGASSTAAGVVVGVYGLATAAGSWLIGRLPARLVPRLPLIAGGAAMVAGYLVAATAQTAVTILAASVLLGLAFSLFHSAFQTWATQLVPPARGLVTSVFASCVFTGAAAGSAWAGGLAARHAFGTLFATAAILAAAVSVVGIIARLRYRPGQ